MNNETLFWKKREFLSFVLSILVLFIHTYFVPEVTGAGFVAVMNHKVSYFFSRSITQFAVPMFFILSGVTFYKGYNSKQYLAKMKSRLRTLVLPYLIWNTVWMLWGFVNGSTPLTLPHLLRGIFFYGSLPPFWFIFDLIIFTFSAPLLFCVIRKKAVGIAVVAVLAVGSRFGFHLPEAVFYYPTAIVFYLIGALIGYHGFDFVAKPSSKPVQIASFVFLLVYILAKNIVPRDLHVTNYLIQIVVYTLAAGALWNVTDSFIEKLKPRAMYRRSFAIYAIHLNISIAVAKVLSLCLPASEWLEIPKFFVIVVGTLVIIHLVCAFLEKYFPKVSALVFGNRTAGVPR